MKIEILPIGGGHNLVVNSQILNTVPHQKSDCMKAKHDLITKRRTVHEIIDNFVPVVVLAPKVAEVNPEPTPEPKPVVSNVVTGATGRPKRKLKSKPAK